MTEEWKTCGGCDRYRQRRCSENKDSNLCLHMRNEADAKLVVAEQTIEALNNKFRDDTRMLNERWGCITELNEKLKGKEIKVGHLAEEITGLTEIVKQNYNRAADAEAKLVAMEEKAMNYKALLELNKKIMEKSDEHSDGIYAKQNEKIAKLEAEVEARGHALDTDSKKITELKAKLAAEYKLGRIDGAKAEHTAVKEIIAELEADMNKNAEKAELWACRALKAEAEVKKAHKAGFRDGWERGTVHGGCNIIPDDWEGYYEDYKPSGGGKGGVPSVNARHWPESDHGTQGALSVVGSAPAPETLEDFGKFYGDVKSKYCPICNSKIPMKIANDGTFIGWGEHKCRTEIIEAYNRGKNDCPEVKQEDEVKRLYDIIENMKKCCKGWRCVERELCKNGIPFIYDEAPCGRLTCIGCTKFASGCEYIEKSKSYFINRAWFNFNFKKDNWHSCDDHGPDFKCYGDDDCDGPVCRREADDRVKAAEQCAESSRMCANDSQVRWEKGQAEIDKLISELKYVKEKYVWTKITEKKYQADKKKFEARAKK